MMMLELLCIPLLVLLGYGCWLGSRYPHIRRMALRNLAAGKTTAILTTIGLAVSISLITMLFAVSDSLERSSEDELEARFGGVDYEIHAIHHSTVPVHYFVEEDIRKLRQSMDEASSRMLPTLSYAVTLSRHGEGGSDSIASNVLVMGVEASEAAEFDAELRDMPRMLLEDGTVILSETLARRLRVGAGSFIDIVDLNNQKQPFRVERIVADRGLAGYRGMNAASGTALLSIGSARQLFLLGDNTYNSVLIAGEPPSEDWNAAPVRMNASRSASELSNFISFLLGITSLNAVMLGLVLMFNLYRLLTDERRLESGILRSIGFSRVDLKRMLRMEGLIMSGAAGVIGSAAGAGMGTLLTDSIARFFGERPDIERVYHYAPHLTAIVAGCSVGMGLIFLCIWVVTNNTAKQPLSMMLWPDKDKAELRFSASKLLTDWFSLFVFALMIFTALVLAHPAIRKEWLTDSYLPFIVGGLLLFVPMLAFASVQWLEWGYRIMRVLFRKLSAIYGMLNVTVRTLTENRIRTGLLILMFATVSCFIGFSVALSGFMTAYQEHSDHRQLIGGFDLYAYDYYSTNGKLTRSEELGEDLRAGFNGNAAPSYAAVVQLPWKTENGDYGEKVYMINGIDAAYAKSTQNRLLERVTGYAQDRDAWFGAAMDREVMIVSSGTLRLLGGNFRLGDRIPLTVGDRTVYKRLIGIAEEEGNWNPFTYGIWMNGDEAISLGDGDKRLHTVFLMKFATTELASELQPLVERILSMKNVAPVYNVVDSEYEYMSTMRLFISYFEDFNKLAMGIGVVGLAVLLARIARQRRYQTGVLRAIGIPSKWLYFCLGAEGMLIGSIGVGMGLLVGSYFGYAISVSQLSGIEGEASFAFPFSRLLLLFSVALLVVGTAVVGSTRAVYRVPPAEATKYREHC